MRVHNILLLFAIFAISCGGEPVQQMVECDSGNSGLTLPEGFCARVFADQVGSARHIAVASNGDVYVALEGGDGGVLALRDTSGDGRADVLVKTSLEGGSGIALRGDSLYFSTPSAVLRFRIDSADFGALGRPDTIVRGMPAGGHSSRSLALGDSSGLFVSIGSAGNVCGGENPCRELSERAAIWKFTTSKKNQTLADGERYASGIRNAVGLTWNPAFRSLFATQHGRDQLGQFSELYSRRDADVLPSEEFMRVPAGVDFGWPYCYHDWRSNQKVLAPEYGGDGVKQERCASVARPLMGFPGHWGPNGLVFYDGAQFPERYRGGAFIAFHGSWNRRDQDGYNVVFVPFRGAMPAGDYEIFADGFAGGRKDPGNAEHRPVGLAVAPDGSLYISEDQRGRIYNVRFARRGSQ
ncbi:MAG: PQQ-dependent sugar dehydrogenase [Gemmatimonadota bacterium]